MAEIIRTTEIIVNKEELIKLLIEHFNIPSDSNFYFKLKTIHDPDPMGMFDSSYQVFDTLKITYKDN